MFENIIENTYFVFNSFFRTNYERKKNINYSWRILEINMGRKLNFLEL